MTDVCPKLIERVKPLLGLDRPEECERNLVGN